MSGNFRTEADVMIAAAGRVDDTNSEVNAELNRLRGVVDGVRSSWVGQAQNSFDQLMVRWNDSARQLQEALDSISGNIRSNARNFDNIEAQNAQAFSAVGGDGAAAGLVL
ncbi:WXG100 family type VII secretion target [Corynebacterium caspium]|uniref:WXG100 family type VII secretion target n=1 Tax=Corynebacterium caspium TaxID=234828 RepID=UPI00037F71C4|nr:WXG100 family type VII secretion target [Corynebacterium caspium]WKD59807.1 WXG domain conatining protein [Corynebacterium caspium DSM 44850]